MTLASGFSARISVRVAKPSLVPSGSGGRPRSSVTTDGSCSRTISIACSRSEAVTTR